MENIFSKVKAVGKVVLIPIECIKPNPNQPRKYFNEDKIIELAQSIKLNGLIQPIIVRNGQDNSYEIIAGERRYRACMKLGCSVIPAVVKSIDTQKSAVSALVENLLRDDLSFFEEAQAIKALIDKYNYTQTELALKICKTQSTIANKIRLLRLEPKAQQKIMEYNLSERHARALLRIEDKNMLMRVIEHINDYELNVAQTERYIENLLDIDCEKQKKKTLYIIKDVKIFINTLNRAVDVMKESGINAKTVIDEGEETITYTVTIPKKSAVRNKNQKNSQKEHLVG